MRIKVSDPSDFTIENVRKLILLGNDNVTTQFRVTKDGFFFLAENPNTEGLENILFRLESNGAGNGYVGQNGAQDEMWVKRIYDTIKENWRNPTMTYIDIF